MSRAFAGHGDGLCRNFIKRRLTCDEGADQSASEIVGIDFVLCRGSGSPAEAALSRGFELGVVKTRGT